MRSRGLTLFEILCTVAIIVTLLSVALPAFARSKKKAKDLQCTSNLKQLYYAIEIYRQDHNTDAGSTAPQMGYPDVHTAMKMSSKLFGNRACHEAPWGPIYSEFPYIYYGRGDVFFGEPGSIRFGEYYAGVGDHGVLLADLSHNDDNLPWLSDHTELLAFTVNIGGGFRKFRSSGDFFFLPGPFWDNYHK